VARAPKCWVLLHLPESSTSLMTRRLIADGPRAGNASCLLPNAQPTRGVGTRLADALIAATALGHDLPLATRNLQHFTPIEGLRVEKPYD